MTETQSMTRPFTAFSGTRLLAAGPLLEVALAMKNAETDGAADGAPVHAFDDATGELVDLDLRGSKEDVIARLSRPERRSARRRGKPTPAVAGDPPPAPAPQRGPGRPRLGVVAREVTLLPRHWEWLSQQPGGASVTLRKLVDTARKSGGARRRAAHEAAYRFMRAIAGDFPGFEEATRALFADDEDRCTRHMADWPKDVRDYALRLGFAGRPVEAAAATQP